MAPLCWKSGTGKVLELHGAASNIFVADPKVAEVRPASASSLFVFGIAAGHTTVAAMDAAGHVLAQYDLTVQPSSFGANTAQAMIARLVPDAHVQVQAQAHGLLLTGTASSPSDVAQAVAIAKGYAGDTSNVENQITIAAPIQVTLNVRIAADVAHGRAQSRHQLGGAGQCRPGLAHLACIGTDRGRHSRCGSDAGRQHACQGVRLQWRDRRPGERQPGACPGRAEPDGDERPAGELPGRRRVSDSGRPAERHDHASTSKATACC